MSSLKPINASRAKAARSEGPIAAEGEVLSSANALRYDRLAECVVMKGESSEYFNDLMAQHIARFAPVDGVEFGIIEEMAVAYWRMRRTWAIEHRLMKKAFRQQPPGDEAARIAAASELATSSELKHLHRYEASLYRIYQRALRNLVLLRKMRNYETNPFRPPTTRQRTPSQEAVAPSSVNNEANCDLNSTPRADHR